ncbi:hypothetical protein Ancab_017142 [Ancistrocladus abbreviatus]
MASEEKELEVVLLGQRSEYASSDVKSHLASRERRKEIDTDSPSEYSWHSGALREVPSPSDEETIVNLQLLNC